MGALAAIVFILTVAILVLVAVAFWRVGKKRGGGRRRSSSSAPAAYDSQTNDIVQLTIVTTTGAESGATGADDSGFLTILSTTVKTSGDTNTLFCDVSAQTSVAIFEADDNATGISLVASSSGEFAEIDVQVLVDGFVAAPGIVTFDNVTHLYAANLLPEDLRAELLSTTSANSFHFIAQNVPKGSHSVVVQARLQTSAFAVSELASSATAVVAERSLVVQPAVVG